MTTSASTASAVHRFRCLDNGHILEEPRKVSGPLATRQSAWCVAHDCPAVGVAVETGPRADTPGGR